MNIVLFEPEIPANTGNIARTCAVTGTSLHLIKPLGFSIDDKHLKRAGLDYWHMLELHVYNDYIDFRQKNPNVTMYYFTTKAHKTYIDIKYDENDFFVFGPETRGLPKYVLENGEGCAVRIPMGKEFRSLNLSNTVAIALYEGLRQTGFPNLD